MDAYERSFEEAKAIAVAVPEAVLIGGWAVWCFNPRLKSRDIDVLVSPGDGWKLAAHLKGRGFVETSGAHLRKRGFRSLVEETSIDVDVYDTVLGPYRVEELLPRWVARDLGGPPMRVLEPTDLFVLKTHAAVDRRGTEKGTKDLADLLALLASEGGSITWDRVRERTPGKPTREILRTALADYRTTSKIYPLSLEEYRRLKRIAARARII